MVLWGTLWNPHSSLTLFTVKEPSVLRSCSTFLWMIRSSLLVIFRGLSGEFFYRPFFRALNIDRLMHVKFGISSITVIKWMPAMFHHIYRPEGDTHPRLWLGFGPLWGGIYYVPYCQYSFNSGYTTSVDCVLMVPSTNTGKQPPHPYTRIYLF